MRVLIHTDEYTPTAQACANRMRSFADALIASGADVTVICSGANLESGAPKTGPEKVIYAPAFRMRKKTAARRLLNNITFIFSSFFCSLRAGKADFVITTSPPPLVGIAGWMIARVKRATLVYDVRDIWPDVALEMGSFSESSLYCRMFRRVTTFLYRHADMITTVSPGKLEKLRERCISLGRSGANLFLVANGFDEKVESYPLNEETADKYGLRDAPACVYIGNIGLAQGLGALLQLAADTEHRDIRFLLFGKGAEKDALEAKAKEEGLSNVTFCGPLPYEDVRTVLHYAHVSFIPLRSSKMKDSIPTKLYEALGIGCPVLLVAEGDSCDVLDEAGLGRHLSPDHLEQLKETFDRMMEDYPELIRKRDSARKLMHEKYTRQKIGEAFAGLLRERQKKEGR